jgi:hypothetical protein
MASVAAIVSDGAQARTGHPWPPLQKPAQTQARCAATSRSPEYAPPAGARVYLSTLLELGSTLLVDGTTTLLTSVNTRDIGTSFRSLYDLQEPFSPYQAIPFASMGWLIR